MLNKATKRYASVAALITIALGLLIWASTYSASYEYCQVERHSSRADKGDFPREIAYFAVCEGVTIDVNGDLITALGTLAIAAFTLTLWLTSAEQAKLTLRSVKSAEDALTLLERPYLYVTDVVGFEFAPGTDWEDTPFVNFRVINHGKLPARLDEMLIVNESTPAMHPDLGIEDPTATISRNSIFGPGEGTPDRSFVPSDGNIPLDQRVKWKMPDPNDPDEASRPWAVLPDGETYFFRVILRYRGPFTEGHETSACWRLEGGSTFEPFGGDRFNYVR